MSGTAYGGSWWAETMTPAPRYASLQDDVVAEICVVGGGLAGLTAAYELSRAGRDVVLLEAERIACRASGRNGGFVIPGFSLAADKLLKRLKRFGPAAAAAMWQLSADGVAYVRRIADGMQSANVVPGILLVQRTDDFEAAVEEAAALTAFGTNAVAWSTTQVREALRSEAYYQGLYLQDAFQIHPLNYALGLAAAFQAPPAGTTPSTPGRLFEDSPVAGYARNRARKKVITANGAVSAETVILAHGIHTKRIARGTAGVMPIVTHIAVTEPIPQLRQFVRINAGISDTRRVPTYYRIVGDDRLLWGGAVTFRIPDHAALVEKIKAEIIRDYPQFAGVQISHAWTGEMAFLINEMPLIDELNPGLWQINAFGGHGLNTTAMAGELVARAILRGDTTWRQFKRLKWRFAPPDPFGRYGAYGMYLKYRRDDFADETRARRAT